MSIIPIASPDVPVLWHNAVVDIEPTSQYGLDRDLTSINSTLCYLNSTDHPLDVTLLAPSHAETECNVRRQSREKAAHQEPEPLDRSHYQSVLQALADGDWSAEPMQRILNQSSKQYAASATLAPGAQVLRFHTRVPITPDEAGIYQFALSVPIGAGALKREAALSILVLLPNDAPDCRVELLDWSVEPHSPSRVSAFGHQGQEFLAGRPAMAWLWAREPFVWLKYRYRR